MSDWEVAEWRVRHNRACETIDTQAARITALEERIAARECELSAATTRIMALEDELAAVQAENTRMQNLLMSTWRGGKK